MKPQLGYRQKGSVAQLAPDDVAPLLLHYTLYSLPVLSQGWVQGRLFL